MVEKKKVEPVQSFFIKCRLCMHIIIIEVLHIYTLHMFELNILRVRKTSKMKIICKKLVMIFSSKFKTEAFKHIYPNIYNFWKTFINWLFVRNHRTSVMREFSASRHFFKTNVTQSVAELILYSQKTRNCGHFLSNLVN